MAASRRAEQLLAAALQSHDVPKSHSQEKTNMNNAANNANTSANLNDAAADLNRAEAELNQARRNEIRDLEELVRSSRERLEQLRKEEKVAGNLLAGAAEPSTAATVLKYTTYAAGAIGLGALGLWAYGRFSGRGAEEVIQSAGEAVAAAGDAVASAAA